MKPRLDISDECMRAMCGNRWPEDHLLIIRSKNYDERTKKSQGRKEKTCPDPEGKKGRQESQKGIIKKFPGQ
jgi:hypothetical protein